MSAQNVEFEKWYESRFGKEGLKTTLNHPYLLDGEYLYESTRDRLLIWQAATAEANKRIAELESNVAELKERIETHIAINKSLLMQRDELQADNKRLREGVAIIKNSSDDLNTIAQLQANNHDLREALVNCLDMIGHEDNIEYINKVLSATPAESLQAHDDEVISMIVAIVDDETGNADLVARIEALKEVK